MMRLAVGLTAGHVERLGGKESVRRSAPCARIETVPDAAGAGATLLAVLTESPSDSLASSAPRKRTSSSLT